MASGEGPAPLPSGTVTFLFTDIEGSTRRWETEPDAMRAALALHDETLRSLIETHGGQIFKHTGDGVCAAFDSSSNALRAAIECQRAVELPVRMGLATGEAMPEHGDYFGPTLNRAARVMSAGHGGQILAAASATHGSDGTDATDGTDVAAEHEMLDLGRRRLRDLSEPIQIFQIVAAGLGLDFPPLKTVDAVPGNLPARTTSFVGRENEMAELVQLVGTHRLVTLTGVGGVGKTSLAAHVAAELTSQFVDGVWIVELAPVGSGEALPAAVATVFGVTPQAGTTLTDSIASALAGRRLLIVLDNCEHVLGAAADFVAEILERAATVTILATSREGLGIGPEYAWPVPTLAVTPEVTSPAVALFMERAREASHDAGLDDDRTLAAVVDICEQLDGIALAIELAAARTVSMNVEEIRDRLDDRFKLLSSGRGGAERHHTLAQAVQWSYDLLDDDERTVLSMCSVFSDGFDLGATADVRDSDDEFAMLDLLDSLVRKSLVVADRQGQRTRYRLLETIRQFGEGQLASTDSLVGARDRHARHYVSRLEHFWEVWDSPDQRASLDWVDVEFANLRSAFRWSLDREDLAGAAMVAAHCSIICWPLQRFEPVGWAEEMLDRAVAADIALLPRVYVAASLCLYSGRPDLGVEYAKRAAELEADGSRYDPFVDGWSGMLEALAHLFGGRIERRVEICEELATRSGFARVVGLCGLTWALPAVGRHAEATAIADETLQVARDFGNPFWIGWALGGYGRAFASTEPERALAALREGLAYARDHRLGFWQANLSQDAARLEATHGELGDALKLFTESIDSFHAAGNEVFLAATLASLAVFFDRFDECEIAATIYGSSTRQASISLVPDLVRVVEHLRSTLGEATFDRCVQTGAAQTLGEAVRYSQQQIRSIGGQLVANLDSSGVGE